MPGSSAAKAAGTTQGKDTAKTPSEEFRLLGRGFGAGADFGGGAEAFVVGVFDGDANVDGTGVEVEGVVGVGVSGDPEVAEKIFAISCEVGEAIFAVLRDDVGNGFAVSFHDLEIVVVDPDATFEIALFFRDDFGSDVENVGG